MGDAELIPKDQEQAVKLGNGRKWMCLCSSCTYQQDTLRSLTNPLKYRQGMLGTGKVEGQYATSDCLEVRPVPQIGFAAEYPGPLNWCI